MNKVFLDEALEIVIHLKHDRDNSNKYRRITNPCNEAENAACNICNIFAEPRQCWKQFTIDITEFHFHISMAVRPDKLQELKLYHSKQCHLLWCCNMLRCGKLYLDR